MAARLCLSASANIVRMRVYFDSRAGECFSPQTFSARAQPANIRNQCGAGSRSWKR
ncbi:hypothetical protein TRAPUB_1604 [Trametes pubescens]|uniref:Uncharacterized protein n=1 Tax=Trametes pubescens TaxID=154538 RepID=A0A1M2VIW4_TRAPU|nr:hypothetical protein TRAPUB_1604 [Trametes pubescens]